MLLLLLRGGFVHYFGGFPEIGGIVLWMGR